jgi:hypothetical protein
MVTSWAIGAGHQNDLATVLRERRRRRQTPDSRAIGMKDIVRQFVCAQIIEPASKLVKLT